MKAIRVHQAGSAEVLCWEELPRPAAGPGEAVVQIEVAGVNFIDVYFRTGLYPAPLPMTLGLEAAGTVVSVAPGVTLVRPGDRVAYSGVPGAYAEYAAVPEDRLIVLPAGLSTRQGAAMMLQGMTAHYLACSTYPLKPDDTCLVHAAAGGVGLLLCQVAKLRGARVIGTVSTAEKARLVREAGADEVILYTQSDFVSETRRLTAGRGVQVVYDSVGRDTFVRGLDCLVPRGMMVLFGQSSGVVDPLEPQLLSQKGSLFLTRPSLHFYTQDRAELELRAQAVAEWVLSGALRLLIGAEFPLAEAAAAHRALEGRRTTGKVLLLP